MAIDKNDYNRFVETGKGIVVITPAKSLGDSITSDKSKCPKCGSSNVVSMIYGFPSNNKELENQLENNEVALGGCVFDPDSHDEWHCNECGFEF